MSSGLLQGSEFLRLSSLIFIIYSLRTIVFIFIFIFTKFQPICPPAFFRSKLNDFYHIRFSDCCLHLYCYIYSVSTDVSSSFFRVFPVKVGSLHGISSHIFYLTHRVLALSILVLLPACSQD